MSGTEHDEPVIEVDAATYERFEEQRQKTKTVDVPTMDQATFLNALLDTEQAIREGYYDRSVDTEGDPDGEYGVELIHCGGCERHSPLEDAKAMARRDGIDIDEPHCPRCGTHVEYEDTTVETFVPRSVDTGTDGNGGEA